MSYVKGILKNSQLTWSMFEGWTFSKHLTMTTWGNFLTSFSSTKNLPMIISTTGHWNNRSVYSCLFINLFHSSCIGFFLLYFHLFASCFLLLTLIHFSSSFLFWKKIIDDNLHAKCVTKIVMHVLVYWIVQLVCASSSQSMSIGLFPSTDHFLLRTFYRRWHFECEFTHLLVCS